MTVVQHPPQIRIELDMQADAAYIYLSDGEVYETHEVNDQVNVDLDEHGVVVGIETLSLYAEIPFHELETAYHVHSDVIAFIRLVRPNPMVFVGFVSQSDAQSTSAPAWTHEACSV